VKLDKVTLNQNKIYNSYDIARISGNNIFIAYTPADNGRLTSRYAYWSLTKITYPYSYLHKDFTVRSRDEKQPKLQEVIGWVNEKHGLDVTEKDPFGAYQVVGTMEKIKAIIENTAKELTQGQG